MCRFKTIALHTHRCTNCGLTVRSKFPPERIHRRCLAANEEGRTKNEELSGLALPSSLFVLRLLRRHRSWVHLPLDVIRENLAACHACEKYTEAGCRRFAGCQSGERYVTELLFGRCPRWRSSLSPR